MTGQHGTQVLKHEYPVYSLINLIGTPFHNVIVNNSVGLFYLEIQIVPTVDIRHGDGIIVSVPRRLYFPALQ